MDFRYGGYDDTICALIYGNVYEVNTKYDFKDSLTPLNNVTIKVEQNNKTVLTDANGAFVIGLEGGVYSLTLSKDGYQSINITNYVSRPDQISQTKIILEKGKVLQKFQIPDE